MDVTAYVRSRGWDPATLDATQIAELRAKFPTLPKLARDLLASSIDVAENLWGRDGREVESWGDVHATKTATPLLKSGSPLAIRHGGDDPLMSVRREILCSSMTQPFMRAHASCSRSMKLEHGVLTVQGNGGEVHRFDCRLPTGVHAEVIDGKYLALADTRGVGFSDSLLGLMPSEGKWALIAPYAVHDDQVTFSSVLGKSTTTGFSSPQEKIDELKESMYQREYDAGTQTIAIGDRSLLARGPDRDGWCELTSGNSSILIDPETHALKPGKGWNSTAAIDASDLANGKIRVGETTRGERHEFELTLDFGNHNPRRSYDAEQLS